ncbi:MAG: 30S ribosomal protein S16 [Candidatus Pacebacteria bacterium]|nr:30S ribosomal protein S16 [Candidatus Paceibacterota bacterium]
MVKIRLARFGKKHQPTYRIVAVDSREKRSGKYLEVLGFYNPSLHPPQVKLDQKSYLNWLEKGAQPSATVANLAKIKKGN